MHINPEIFRTYDIRGKFPEDFSSEAVLSIGRAFATLFGTNKNIVIGTDVRISSPLIKSLLSAGLMQSGCNVVDIGICTTPTIYFLAVSNLEIDAGIMITASHNPIDYNGIKVCNRQGVSYHIDNFFSNVKAIIEQKKFKSVKNTEYGQPIAIKNISSSKYWQFQKENFNPRRKLKIIVDIGNGTCYPIIKLLESKDIIVDALHPEPNGLFPIMIPDPAKSSCLKYLQSAIENDKMDLGIGFDADGDRIGFVDDQSKIIQPDKIIMLFGESILKKCPKAKILVDVKTSRATYEYLTELGAQVSFTRVGHSWIHEALINSSSTFAGELSGHYYFGYGYYGFDDAVYSALRMIEILSEQEFPLSKIIESLPTYSISDELRIPCPEKYHESIITNIKKILKEEALHSITIDGIRAEFEDGWILIRKSGTEPVISVRSEATTYKKLLYYQKYANELIDKEIEKIDNMSTAGLIDDISNDWK